MQNLNDLAGLNLNPGENKKFETPEEVMAHYKEERDRLLKEYLKRTHEVL